MFISVLCLIFFYLMLLCFITLRGTNSSLLMKGGGEANNIFSILVCGRSQACKIRTPLKSSEIQSILSAEPLCDK